MGSQLSAFAKRMEAERVRRDLTFAEWAKTLGVSVGCAHEWTSGKHIPPPRRWKKLARVLRCDLDTLVKELAS